MARIDWVRSDRKDNFRKEFASDSASKMPLLPAKPSHEDLKKQAEMAYSLSSVLSSIDKLDNESPLYTLLHEDSTFNSSLILETLMKLSYDDKSRQTICFLGGLQAIAGLLKQSNRISEDTSLDETAIKKCCHACTALANLTYGHPENKNMLVSMDGLVPALLDQLKSSNEELQRVAAGVLRNLSCNADASSKEILRNVDIIPALMSAAVKAKEEPTLEYLLNVLWNVSGHSEENKKDICEFSGSLEFITSLLVYKSPSQSFTIIENGGGILKNISSYITVHEHLRQVLRRKKCFEILLQHLQFPNVTIVSNACGTLWNLSARCDEDRQTLCKLGAVTLLGKLVTSEHKNIAVASSAALKKLLNFKMNNSNFLATNNYTDEAEMYEKENTNSCLPRDDNSQKVKEVSKKKKMLNEPPLFAPDICMKTSAGAASKVPLHPSNSGLRVYDFEEYPDEPIDFSTKYKEFHEQPQNWPSKSLSGISTFKPFSCEGESIVEPTSRMNRTTIKAFCPRPDSSGGMADRMAMTMKMTGGVIPLEMAVATRQVQYMYQTYRDSFGLSSTPEHPKNYCTEDTPDDHSLYNGSTNNIAGFGSSEMEVYRTSLNSNHIVSNNVDKLRSSKFNILPTNCNPNLVSQQTSAASEGSKYGSKSLHGVHGLPNAIIKEDHTALNNQKEVPKQYFTEDTPHGFSRASSLSSLSVKSLENCDPDKFNERSLQSARISHNISEKKTSQDVKKPGVGNRGSSKLFVPAFCHGTKTVTFDETNQTPLMFSRTSSLASLNSFDAHSVHSSLISEYSRRASSVVSPSELPNSAGDTPPSPQQKKVESKSCNYIVSKDGKNKDEKCVTDARFSSTIESNQDVGRKHDSDCSLSDNEDEYGDDLLSEVIRAAMPKDKHSKVVGKAAVCKSSTNAKPLYLSEKKSAKPQFLHPVSDSIPDSSFADTTKTYAIEGTPLEYSRYTSLSNLTFDDSPAEKVCNDIESCGQDYSEASKRLIIEVPSPGYEDSVHNYVCEGTPITFSRNDSLSSLSSKEFNSPTKINACNADLHPKIKALQKLFGSVDTFKPDVARLANLTSTPCNKASSSDTKSIQTTENETCCKSMKNDDDLFGSHNLSNLNDSSILLAEGGDCDASSLSSSFSCESSDSDEALPSLEQCIEDALPKDEKKKKTNLSTKSECLKASLKNVSPHQQKDNLEDSHQNKRNLNHEGFSYSEDDDTEANNTVIYRGPLDTSVQKEKSTTEESNVSEEIVEEIGKCDMNVLTDLIDEFYNKTCLPDFEGSRFQVKDCNQSESSTASETTLDVCHATSTAPSSDRVTEKKVSRNKLINFFKRHSIRRKKSRSNSTNEDSIKNCESFGKSLHKHRFNSDR